MSNSHKLLLQSFGRIRDGLWHCIGSAIDTDQGTAALWNYLEREEMVEKSHKSLFGHRFSYRITPKGNYAIISTPTALTESFQ